MLKNRSWVLGAADVEMAANEQFLRNCGETVVYAVGPDGQRVHPGNAYQAVGASVPGWAEDADATYYLVECGFADPLPRNWVVVDHHRPGDPGYGKGPEDFRMASSIGQVLMRVAELTGGDPDDAVYSMCPDHAMTAAADHCLEAAYRGRCPGVDPDALMRWRVEQRAAHQGRSVEAVMEDIASARRRLRGTIEAARSIFYGDESGQSHHVAEWQTHVADLRGESIPELPEAACREGIPFLSTVRDRGAKMVHCYATPDPAKGCWEEGDAAWEWTAPGREKVVLQAAPAGMVRRFMAGALVPGLTGYYGDPARGFAGGYTEQRTQQ